MRRSKANKQGNDKLMMKIIRSPIRILRKARDFYMRSIEECAGAFGQVGRGVVCPAPPAASGLPKSFTVSSSMGSSYDEELRRLLRTTSQRGDIGSKAAERKMQRRQSRLKEPTIAMRSYSVGVGKIGRIDEDKPCSFEEDDSMTDLLFSRSRSHVVRRNLIVYR